MAKAQQKIEIYLEVGKKRNFAGAIDWPGWCRSGRDEETACQALLDKAQAYAQILHAAHIDFQPPTTLAQLEISERLPGNTTTDFGAPDAAPTADQAPLDQATLARFQELLAAYWQAFDRTIATATGKPLRKGPRGGGRELDGIIGHVLDAEKGYLGSLGQKLAKKAEETLDARRQTMQQAMLDALTVAANGELPARGPRGGVLWPPRYYMRRVTWHLLDHLWEIEDRIEQV